MGLKRSVQAFRIECPRRADHFPNLARNLRDSPRGFTVMEGAELVHKPLLYHSEVVRLGDPDAQQPETSSIDSPKRRAHVRREVADPKDDVAVIHFHGRANDARRRAIGREGGVCGCSAHEASFPDP